MNTRHTLSVLVENKPGVLTRVAALFARRAFNIHSLAVGETEDPQLSRITVVVDAAERPLEQVTKQLNKLVNVLKIVELEPESTVERQLLLVKVSASDSTRANVLQVVDLFRAHDWSGTRGTVRKRLVRLNSITEKLRRKTWQKSSMMTMQTSPSFNLRE